MRMDKMSPVACNTVASLATGPICCIVRRTTSGSPSGCSLGSDPGSTLASPDARPLSVRLQSTITPEWVSDHVAAGLDHPAAPIRYCMLVEYGDWRPAVDVVTDLGHQRVELFSELGVTPQALFEPPTKLGNHLRLLRLVRRGPRPAQLLQV